VDAVSTLSDRIASSVVVARRIQLVRGSQLFSRDPNQLKLVPPSIEQYGDRQAIANGESSAEVATICTSSSFAASSRAPIVQGCF
jgi:hypothetical protein